MFIRTFIVCLIFITVACAPSVSILDKFEPVPSAPIATAPAGQPGSNASPATIERGRYMVELLGCGGCHTQGALMGRPDAAKSLAGSNIGIAHANPLVVDRPGVVFPPNLTPDTETGIAYIPDEALKASIRGDAGRHNIRRLRVMPVIAYSKVKDEDVDAIVAYLRSLPPVHNPIPRNVPEGRATQETYVHFGVYRSREK